MPRSRGSAHRRAGRVCRGWELLRVVCCGGWRSCRACRRKKPLRFSVTCWARLVRSSYMVRTTPSSSSLGLKACWTRPMVPEELADAFEGEVLRLHGNEQAVCGHEGVEGEQVECGRAVEDDEVVGDAQLFEGVAKAGLAVLAVHQLEIGADQVATAWDDLEGLDGRGQKERVHGSAAGDEVIDRAVVAIARDAEAAGAVGLGIAVDEDALQSFESEGGAEIDRGRGLADATFLVGDSEADGFRHCKQSYGEAGGDANRSNGGSCGRSCGIPGHRRMFHVEHQKIHRVTCSTWNAKGVVQCAKRGP